ncbi:MAG: hypothetical protein II034_05600, partial [Muribaculaceae bacterium]|nr:hypothetical protein [Muribaculaceae bacterium]
MKKFLLSAFAVAVAFSAAAFQMAPNRHVMTPKSKIEKVVKPAPMKLKKAGAKISSISDISGSYVLMSYNLFTGNPVYSGVTIAKTSDNTYNISGFGADATATLTGTVDPDNNTLTIPRQEIYRYEGDGHIEAADLVVLDLDSLNANSLASTDASLVFEIYSNGIFSEDYYGWEITEYSDNGVTNQNAIGQFFEAYGLAYLLESNGTMTWTNSTYSTNNNVNVYIEQSNDTIYVSNFGG